MSDTSVAVTVAVSTCNRAARLRRLLEALANQDLAGDRYEIVVCDDGSTDETPEVLRDWANAAPVATTVIRVDHNSGPAAGRNRAWRAGTGPVVAFIDDDCTPSRSWLSAGLGAMDGDLAVVGGRTVPRQDQLHNRGPFSMTIEVNELRFGETCNIFYRRRDLERLGGFDERFPNAAGEDTDLYLRARALGLSGVFARDALVEHDVVRRGGWQAFRQTFRWMDLPLVVRKNAGARSLLYMGVFWKRSHPWTILAVAGLAGASRRRGAIVQVLPWVVYRWRVDPLSPSRRVRLATLPACLLVDAGEVAACIAGSIRHRSLLL